MYYTTLARILFAEDNVDADFWRFVKSWETTLDQVARAFQFQGRGELSEEDIRVSLRPVHKRITLCALSRTDIPEHCKRRAYSPILLPI